MAEPGQAAEREEAVDKVEVARVVPSQPALSVPAFVLHAGIVNRMSGECPAFRSSARCAVPP